MDKYYLALGKFVTTFAYTEDLLLILLSTTVGIKGKDAPALFSGTRTRDAIKFIRRLHEARGLPTPANLDEVFKQLTAINTARDHILHWGARDVNGALQVNNLERAHAERSLVAMPVSEEIVTRMSLDLETIGARITTLYLEKVPPSAGVQSMPGYEGVLALAQRPWLYKPAQLETKGLPTTLDAQEP